MDWTEFCWGAVGALISVYLFKDQLIPTFARVYDPTPLAHDVGELKRKRAQVASRRDTVQRQLDQAAPADRQTYLDELELLEQRHQQLAAELREKERTIRAAEAGSRLTGLLLYIGLGGLVASLIGDSVDVTDTSGNLEAVIIGATWTSYVSALGLRDNKRTAGKLEASMSETRSTLEESRGRIQELAGTAADAQPGTPEATDASAAAPRQLDAAQAGLSEDLLLLRRLLQG